MIIKNNIKETTTFNFVNTVPGYMSCKASCMMCSMYTVPWVRQGTGYGY